MTTPRLSRAEQQVVTRQRLLASAEKVFSRLGYGGASVDLIAEEAGFSKGAVYSNFPGKEAMFLELLEQTMLRDMAQLRQIVSLAPERLFDTLGDWLKTMHIDSDCPLLVTELQLHARRSPVFAEQYYALQEQQTGALAEILGIYFASQHCVVPLSLIDMAGALTALAHGLSLQRPLQKAGQPSDAGRIIDQLINALMRPA